MTISQIAVLTFLCLCSVWHSASSLTRGMCETYNNAALYLDALKIKTEADKTLMQNTFTRQAIGGFQVIVNESIGEQSGGGTNLYGVYGAAVFNSSDILPESVCTSVDSQTTNASVCGNQTAPWTLNFMLGPSDAIVYVGCTPPPVKYFGYDAYINYRTKSSTGKYFAPGVNFGDPISSPRMDKLREGESGNGNANAVFNQPVVIIHTADQASADAVTKAYTAIGMSESSIFVRIIPPSTVRLWDRSGGKLWEETKPDLLSMISRITAPDPKAEEAYDAYKKLLWPLTFYFADDDKTFEPAPEPALIPRSSTNLPNETMIYVDAFGMLRKNVIEKMTKEKLVFHVGTQTLNYTRLGFYDDWNESLAEESNTFILPTRDSTYGLPNGKLPSDFKLTDRTVAVLIGVNHEAALNASYSSVGVDVTIPQPSVTGPFYESHWYLGSDLVGSADRYLSSANMPLSKYLYAVELMQPGGCEANDKFCVEFNSSHTKGNLVTLLGERTYSAEATTIGPDVSAMVSPDLLMFRQL